MADNTGDGRRARLVGITQALPSEAVHALLLIPKPIFQHNWVHCPVTNAPSPLICYKPGRPEGDAPSQEDCLSELLFKGLDGGTAVYFRMSLH